MAMNKGEWSEIYSLLKLISDGALFDGDAYFKKIENSGTPIVYVQRLNNDGTPSRFTLSPDSLSVFYQKNNASQTNITLIRDQYQQQAHSLYEILIQPHKDAFAIPTIESFFQNELGSQVSKAKSTTKADIYICIHDIRSQTNKEYGYSIKSFIGGLPTLFNASPATVIEYNVSGLSPEQIEEINSIDGPAKYKRRLQTIIDFGGTISFEKIGHSIFYANLLAIDEALPPILGQLILNYFLYDKNLLTKNVELLTTQNPRNYPLETGIPFYENKVKKLLTAIALGLRPASPWQGKLEATGGTLVVKENGELISYHLYNWNDFEDSLFVNTKWDTPSFRRYEGCGLIENGKLKLNFQIRFTH